MEKTGEVAYVLKDGNTNVLLGSQLLPLYEIITSKQEEAPLQAVVKYHKMALEKREGCVGFFTLNLRQHLYWKASPLKKDEDNSVKSTHAGTLVSATDCSNFDDFNSHFYNFLNK